VKGERSCQMDGESERTANIEPCLISLKDRNNDFLEDSEFGHFSTSFVSWNFLTLFFPLKVSYRSVSELCLPSTVTRSDTGDDGFTVCTYYVQYVQGCL
jgi:hypothetical protein